MMALRVTVGWAGLTALIAMIVGGCSADAELAQCRKQQADLRQRYAAASEKLADANRTIARQNDRIAELIDLPDDRMAHLVTVDRIQLASLTGGYDENRDGVDDGVVAYIQPVDGAGDVIKRAGSLEVGLYDLSGESPIGVGRSEITAEDSIAAWYGKLWTDHFTVRVPFRTRPMGEEVTVRVRFVELLTGRTFTAQKVCRVNFDPTRATRPAGLD